jgi:hypothetical protein
VDANRRSWDLRIRGDASHILGQIIEMGFLGVQAGKVKDRLPWRVRKAGTEEREYHSPPPQRHAPSTAPYSIIFTSYRRSTDISPPFRQRSTWCRPIRRSSPLLHTKRLPHKPSILYNALPPLMRTGHLVSSTLSMNHTSARLRMGGCLILTEYCVQALSVIMASARHPP